MAIETKPFDAAEHLRDPESRAEYLRAAMETGDADFIANAREIVARAAAAG
ncbi:MAG: transcriptional regulator, partial [Erythrobacter sp.]|nr:transcriptional regulator [Erythrobacter sp.]